MDNDRYNEYPDRERTRANQPRSGAGSGGASSGAGRSGSSSSRPYSQGGAPSSRGTSYQGQSGSYERGSAPTQRSSASNALLKVKLAAMNAAHRKTATVPHKGNTAAMSATPLPAETVHLAPAGLRLPPAPAEAGDMDLPAVPPAHPKSARRNAVIASAFNQEHFLSSRLRWSSLR